MVPTPNLNAENCRRCKIKPVAPPRITTKGKLMPRARCEDCLAYARNWQIEKTAKRRAANECITCGQETDNASRCDRCTSLKAQNYFDTRALAS